MLFFSMNIRATDIYSDIYLQIKVSYDDKTGNHGHKPQSPMMKPKIQQNCNTLIISSNYASWYLEIIQYNDYDEVVYSQFISQNSSTIVLPENLSGEYEIRLTKGNVCLFGYISLEY